MVLGGMPICSRAGPISAIVVASLGFSLSALLVQAMIRLENGPSTLELVMVRAILQTAVGAALMSRTGLATTIYELRSLQRPQLKLLTLRSVMTFVGFALEFTSYALLPLGDAITIQQLAPVFAVILSALLLGLPWHADEMIGAALSFAGVALIAQPGPLMHMLPAPFRPVEVVEPAHGDKHVRRLFGVLFGVGFAMFVGSSSVLIRALYTRYQTSIPLMLSSGSLLSCFISPVGAMLVPGQRLRTLGGSVLWLSMLAAALGVLSMLFFIYGFQREKPVTSTLFRSSEVIFGFFWQIARGDGLSPASAFGAVLILSALALVSICKARRERDAASAEEESAAGAASGLEVGTPEGQTRATMVHADKWADKIWEVGLASQLETGAQNLCLWGGSEGVGSEVSEREGEGDASQKKLQPLRERQQML